jgi:hypothetical protein
MGGIKKRVDKKIGGSGLSPYKLFFSKSNQVEDRRGQFGQRG